MHADIPQNAPAGAPQAAPQARGFMKWVPLVVMSLALAIIILDTTILNVSLRTIIDDLDTDIQSIQWVITGYSLILAAFTILGGRLGDLFGRKRLFVIGAIVFAAGSFITSISHNVGMMILGEAVIEGIGACLMMPATASLLLTTYQGRDRAVAFGVWGGIAAGAAALGPVVGGWLTTYYSWRLAFRINVVVALVLVLGAYLVHEARRAQKRPSIDVVGIALSSLGLLAMVFGFIKASTYGWFAAKAPLVAFGHTLDFGSVSATPLFVALGLILLGAFVFWEKRMDAHPDKTPLVSFSTFRNRQFMVGASVTAFTSLALAGITFTLPVFLQAVRGLDALHTGYALLPLSLAILVASPVAANLSKRIDARRIAQAGLGLTALGFVVLYFSISPDATVWQFAPGLALFGIGMGCVMSQINNLTLSAIPVEEAGEASGVNNTFRQLGATLGSAILGTILLSVLGSQLVAGIQASTVIPDQAKAQIAATAAANTSAIEFGGDTENTDDAPPAITEEITALSHQATSDANKRVALWSLGFVLVAFAISFALRGPREEQDAEVRLYTHESPLKRAGTVAGVVLALAAVGIGGYVWGHRSGAKETPAAAPAPETASVSDTAGVIIVGGEQPTTGEVGGPRAVSDGPAVVAN